jgi:hypothetical protein
MHYDLLFKVNTLVSLIKPKPLIKALKKTTKFNNKIYSKILSNLGDIIIKNIYDIF